MRTRHRLGPHVTNATVRLRAAMMRSRRANKAKVSLPGRADSLHMKEGHHLVHVAISFAIGVPLLENCPLLEGQNGKRLMTLDGGEHGAGTAPACGCRPPSFRGVDRAIHRRVLPQFPDSVIEWISPSVLEVLGAPPAEIIGSRMFERVHPDDRPMVLAKSSDLNSGGSVQHRSCFRTADGSYRWLDVVVDPIVPTASSARIGRARCRR